MKHVPRSFRSGLTAGIGAIALVAGFAGTSLAAEPAPGLTQQERQELEQWWTEYDVPTATQDALLTALESGDVWDALDGAEPVSVQTRELPTESETVERYADGSIVVSTVEVPADPFAAGAPQGGPTTFSVGSCQSSQIGSGYANRYDCKAASTAGVVTMGFYISYTLVQGGYDKIIDVHSGYAYATGGTVGSPTAKIAKVRESSTGSAWAYVKSQWDAFGGGGSKTVEMRALVGKDKAWTRWEHRV